jgi:hypothetical protein
MALLTVATGLVVGYVIAASVFVALRWLVRKKKGYGVQRKEPQGVADCDLRNRANERPDNVIFPAHWH